MKAKKVCKKSRLAFRGMGKNFVLRRRSLIFRLTNRHFFSKSPILHPVYIYIYKRGCILLFSAALSLYIEVVGVRTDFFQKSIDQVGQTVVWVSQVWCLFYGQLRPPLVLLVNSSIQRQSFSFLALVWTMITRV
jgi:hypothetical protein